MVIETDGYSTELCTHICWKQTTMTITCLSIMIYKILLFQMCCGLASKGEAY